MIQLKEAIDDFILIDFGRFVKSKEFQDLQKPSLKYVVELNQNTVRLEELFEAVSVLSCVNFE